MSSGNSLSLPFLRSATHSYSLTRRRRPGLALGSRRRTRLNSARWARVMVAIKRYNSHQRKSRTTATLRWVRSLPPWLRIQSVRTRVAFIGASSPSRRMASQWKRRLQDSHSSRPSRSTRLSHHGHSQLSTATRTTTAALVA